MNDLVQRLSEGKHPVTIGDPKLSLGEFKKRDELLEVFARIEAKRRK